MLNPFEPVTIASLEGASGGSSGGGSRTLKLDTYFEYMCTDDHLKIVDKAKLLSYLNANVPSTVGQVFNGVVFLSDGVHLSYYINHDPSVQEQEQGTIELPNDASVCGVTWDGELSERYDDKVSFVVFYDCTFELSGTTPLHKNESAGWANWALLFLPWQKYFFMFSSFFIDDEELDEDSYRAFWLNATEFHVSFEMSAAGGAQACKVSLKTDKGVVSKTIDPHNSFVEQEYFAPDGETEVALMWFDGGEVPRGSVLRNTSFDIKIVTGGGGGGDDSSNFNAVLLHDVDVTNGMANGTALLHGIVNLNRINEETRAITEQFADANTNHIKLIKA
ncbi:MAG: hypothetical protein MJ168_08050 [Clostridia bacterium]|nr:hypothetical protein [Clostridia bacterium]